MPFSPERYSQLREDLHRALDSPGISEWERSFLRDISKLLDRRGPATRLSDKQYRLLMKLTGSGRRQRGRIGGATQNKYARLRSRSSHRRSKYAWLKRPAFGQILFALVCLGIAIFMAVERFPDKLGPVVALTSIGQVSGRVTRVRDGDTIEVAGTPIRFGSLDCAEWDTSDGRRATARMRSLISGQELTCFLNGRSSYDRKIGSCRLSDGRDLAGVMIQEGKCGRFW